MQAHKISSGMTADAHRRGIGIWAEAHRTSLCVAGHLLHSYEGMPRPYLGLKRILLPMDFLRWSTAPSMDFVKTGSVSLSRLFEETKDEEDAFRRTRGFHPPDDGDVQRSARGRRANRGAAAEGDL